MCASQQRRPVYHRSAEALSTVGNAPAAHFLLVIVMQEFRKGLEEGEKKHNLCSSFKFNLLYPVTPLSEDLNQGRPGGIILLLLLYATRGIIV